MKVVFTVIILFFILTFQFAFAQDAVLSDVHLFQTFLKDAPISLTPYGEAGLGFGDYDGFSSFFIGIQGGYPINPKIELDANWQFLNFSNGNSRSGFSDLTVAGRYLLLEENPIISGGAFLTLPIGNDDVGQGNFDFGIFGALRYPLQNKMVISGTLGLESLEFGNNRETSLLFGGGLIYPASEQLHVLGELNIQTQIDWALLSAGVDYKLQMGSKIRGMLGFGLDDGAPDITIMGSFLHFF
jgi:hypothetical protein